MNDPFADVRPTGLLGRCLDSISNPRKHRWKAYLRACERIPAGSPCHGSTSFTRLNGRRIAMINENIQQGSDWEKLDSDPEYKALDEATSKATCGEMVASSFLLARKLRRLQKLHPEITV